MFKFKKICAAAVSALFMTASLVVPAGAGETVNFDIGGKAVKTGDYFQMGTYYGKPILWRCIAYDENGALMLSDKIICIKAFDADGSVTSGSHGRGGSNGRYRKKWGSDYWGDSNMRDWLNSDAAAGNVVWSCGNPPDSEHVWNGYNAYSTEAGFLTNFTASEKAAIKTVTQKQLLNGYEYNSKKDPNFQILKASIANILQNYDTAYSETTVDKMFLLDIKQLHDLYTDFGDYYMAYPTPEAVKNSTYKNDDLRTDAHWYYWLRSPEASESESDLIRSIYPEGLIHSVVCSNSDPGVRPAFYLNTDAAAVTYGSGTAADPYAINDPFLYGDVDCDKQITAEDAAYMFQKVLVGTFELPVQKKTNDWYKYADVDADTEMTVGDAAYIFQKALVGTFELPAEKNK